MNVKKGIKGFVKVPVLERMSQRITQAKNGCWRWNGATNGSYGQTFVEGKLTQAHRVFFELLRESIPHGMELNHICENKLCVNPDHLEIVSHAENMRYSYRPARNPNPARNVCGKGHPMSGYNLAFNKGHRYCRACHNIWRSQRRQRALLRSLGEAE